MNDRDFDKHFSKRLNEDVQHTFDDTLWGKLSKRLDENDESSAPIGMVTGANSARYLYWLSPLLLLLLATNAWYMWQVNKTQRNNEQMVGEIRSLKTLLQKRDTIIQSKIIYKTDTVYIDKKPAQSAKMGSTGSKIENDNTPFRRNSHGAVLGSRKSVKKAVSVSRSLSSAPFLLNKSTLLSISPSNQKISQDVDNQLFTDNNLINKNISENNPLTDNTTKKVEETSPFKSDIDRNNLTEISPLPLIIPQIELPKLPENDKRELTRSLKSMPIIKPAALKHWLVGLSGSWLNYQTAWTTNAGVEVFKTENSYQVGLRIEYAFNDNWRLMMGSDYCPFNFDITWNDDRYNLPTIPDDVLVNHKMKSVKASEPLLNVFVGGKYVFKGNRARPYLGLAYSTMKILPYEAHYRLQNKTTWEETDRLEPHSGATISNLMMLTGGYEFKLGNRFVGQTEAYFYKDLNKIKKMFDLFGVRATVLMRF